LLRTDVRTRIKITKGKRDGGTRKKQKVGLTVALWSLVGRRHSRCRAKAHLSGRPPVCTTTNYKICTASRRRLALLLRLCVRGQSSPHALQGCLVRLALTPYPT